MTLWTRDEVRDRVDAARGSLEAWLLASDERRSMAVARAIAAVQRASAALATFGQGEHLDERSIEALDASRAALDDAHERLGGVPESAASLAEVRDALAAARKATLDLLSPERAAVGPPPAFTASVGRPSLHGGIEVPDPKLVARDDDDDDDQAAADDADATLSPAELEAGEHEDVIRTRRQIRALGRDCLEDVGIMGSLRRLWDHEPWLDGEAFEQRLLDALDALVALERPVDEDAPRLGLIAEVWRYATEWSIPDRGRSFALGFVLGCVDSKIANVWLSLAIRRAQPAAAEAYVEALALGSSPHLDDLVEDLLLDDDPAVLRAALGAAGRRRRVPPFTAALAAHPDDGVARAAVTSARHLPPDLARPALEPLLVEPRPAIAALAAAALLELGAPEGAARLRDILRSESDGTAIAIATRAVALLGVESDGDLLRQVATKTPELAPWLGWHGWPRHVPFLLEAAAAAGATHLAHATADAVERITGFPFDPGLVLDARSATPAIDADRQRERLREHLAREPPPAGRLRHGMPHAPDLVLAELGAPRARQGARRVLASELAIVSGGRASIDVETWIAAQREALEALRAAPPWRSAR